MNKIQNAQYVCDKCGQLIIGIKAYYIIKHQHRQPNRKGYCSKKCSNLGTTKDRKKFTCKTCGVDVYRLKNRIVGGVFCSTNCAARYNNVKRYISNEKEIKDAIKNHESFVRQTHCKYCEQRLPGRKAYQKFCSQQCQHEYEFEKYINDWKSDKVEGGNSIIGKVSKQVRRYIFTKFNNQCTECGWNKINPHSKRSTLQIEHIDGNANNHKENNLKLLCPSCHSLTPTYGNLNKGHGRKNRKNLTYK